MAEFTLPDLSAFIGESEDSILKKLQDLTKGSNSEQVSFQAKNTKLTSWTFVTDDSAEIEIINHALAKTGTNNSSNAFVEICRVYTAVK